MGPKKPEKKGSKDTSKSPVKPATEKKVKDVSKSPPKSVAKKTPRVKKVKPQITPLQKRKQLKQRTRQLAINKALKVQKKVNELSFNVKYGNNS